MGLYLLLVELISYCMWMNIFFGKWLEYLVECGYGVVMLCCDFDGVGVFVECCLLLVC